MHATRSLTVSSGVVARLTLDMMLARNEVEGEGLLTLCNVR